MAPLSLRQALAATTLCVVLAPAFLAQAQQDKAKSKADRLQKGEGVIVKVEPVGEARGSGEKAARKAARHVRVTVNTDAVWRDYIRDQANLSGKADAKKGEESVATKGQPASPDSLIIAEVGPDSKVVMRYRSSTDETNEGSRTVEKAEKKDQSPESSEVKRSRRDEKAPKIGVSDLKPGLFVEIEARKGKASQVIVLKPVGEGQTPASESTPKKEK